MSQSTQGGNQDGNEPTRFDRLKPAEMVQVNLHCDEFESLWQRSQPASLESFVENLVEPERTAALPELVLIDLVYRRQFHLPVSTEWYLWKFPTLDRRWLVRQAASQRSADSLSGATNDPVPIPAQLGDYLIRDTLGSGGMGHVYRAEHKLMGRVVAIKVLKENRLFDSASRQRFEREVRTIARLSHPNIVTAFDAREENGMLYLVTELVDGEDLARRIKRKGPLPTLEAMHFVWQAAKGLQYAHQQGIVHRDIKPSNLLLDRKKNVKVLDLGLARLQVPDLSRQSEEHSLTSPDHLVGTAAYMAPEQARSALSADERSDIYGLGCTLYFLLRGRPPFRGASDFDTILAHFEQPIPDLSSDVNFASLPAGLIQLVEQMMAKNPADRPQSMNDIVTRLAGFIKVEQRGGSTSSKLPIVEPEQWVTDYLHRSWEYMRTKWLSNKSGKLIVGAGAVGLLLSSFWIGKNWWSDTGNAIVPGPPSSGEQSSIQEELLAADLKGRSLGADLPPESRRESVGGLEFDGVRSYLAVPKFDVPIEGRLQMEVATIPLEQNGPANLTTWSGKRCATLFMSDRRWGFAFFDGQNSRLIVSVQPIRFGELTMVCGTWDGRKLGLQINGQTVSVQPIEYELFSGPAGLFVGGVPPGILPVKQGTRFFRGTIAALRIQQGSGAHTALSLEAMRQATPTTIALFPFLEGNGLTASDATKNHWQGELRNATWSVSQ